MICKPYHGMPNAYTAGPDPEYPVRPYFSAIFGLSDQTVPQMLDLGARIRSHLPAIAAGTVAPLS